MDYTRKDTTKLRILSKCVKRFGTKDGVRLASKLFFKHGEFQIKAPGYRQPILVRQQTSDIEVFEKVLINEEYQSHITDPEVIVDLGANVGYASIFFANRYPQSQIIAIEPEASNFEQLQRNIAAYPNITAIQKAVWPVADEPVHIKNMADAKWSFQVEAGVENDGDAVDVITMPDVLALCGNRQINILKVDIESAEKQLFSHNASQWLDKVDFLMIELHDNMQEGCSHALYRAVLKYPFNQYIVGENIFLQLR